MGPEPPRHAQSALAARLKLPKQLASPRIQRIRIAVQAQNVNSAMSHRGCAVYVGIGFGLPNLAARGGVNGVNKMIVAAHKHQAIGHYGR